MSKMLDTENCSEIIGEYFRKIVIRPIRELKWLIQKLLRGFSDKELWDLDHYLAIIILKRLRAFKAYKRSGLTLSEEDLDKIIEAFDLIVKDDWKDIEDLNNREDKIQIGLRLFSDNFRSFWD
jgi:hypothetical protein